MMMQLGGLRCNDCGLPDMHWLTATRSRLPEMPKSTIRSHSASHIARPAISLRGWLASATALSRTRCSVLSSRLSQNVLTRDNDKTAPVARHGRGWVAVDQNHAVALFAQGADSLRAAVVELGRLADDDGPGARMRMLCRSVRLGIYRYCRACVRERRPVRDAASRRGCRSAVGRYPLRQFIPISQYSFGNVAIDQAIYGFRWPMRKRQSRRISSKY